MDNEFNIDSNKDLVDSATQAVLEALQEWSASMPDKAFIAKILAQIDALTVIKLAICETLCVSPETLEKIMAREIESYKRRTSQRP